MSRYLLPIYRFFYPAKDSEAVRREYGIPENITCQFELRSDGWMTLTSDQLPGLVTEGRNPQEVVEMFNDAILTYFDVPKRDVDILFPSLNLTGIGTITHKDHVAVVHA